MVAYQTKRHNLVREGIVRNIDTLPKVYSSIDGFEGRQKKVIILDQVIFRAVRKGDLGFLLDNARQVIRFARGRSSIIVVMNEAVLGGAYREKKKDPIFEAFAQYCMQNKDSYELSAKAVMDCRITPGSTSVRMCLGNDQLTDCLGFATTETKVGNANDDGMEKGITDVDGGDGTKEEGTGEKVGEVTSDWDAAGYVEAQGDWERDFVDTDPGKSPTRYSST